MRTIIILILLTATQAGQAQESTRITTLDFVEILDNNREEALYYYENNWVVLREMAMKRGYIDSYELLQVAYSEEAPFHLILVTTYADAEQFEVREEHFVGLIEERGALALLNDKKPGEFRKTVFSAEESAHLREQNRALTVRHFIWEDTSRPDSYYGGHRLVNVKVWDYEGRVAGGSPLLLFSPGLGGNIDHYSFLAEFLAKKGFIVAGVNHLYESEYVQTNAGAIIPANNTFHDSLKTLDIPGQITAEEYRSVKGIRQKVLGEDLIFTLDMLLDQPFLKENIDPEKIGVMGHSIGGAAAVYAALLDTRFKAVVDLDGTPPTKGLEQGIEVPFLFIEDLTDYKNHQGYAKMHKRRSDFCRLNRANSWRILLGGIHHNSFLDVPEDIEGREQAQRDLTSIAAYVHSFFTASLLGEKPDFQEVKSEELEIIYFPKE